MRIRLTRDHEREKILGLRGVEVLRFSNHQIRQELDSVLAAIWLALERRAGKNPSPQSSPFDKGRGDSSGCNLKSESLENYCHATHVDSCSCSLDISNLRPALLIGWSSEQP